MRAKSKEQRAKSKSERRKEKGENLVRLISIGNLKNLGRLGNFGNVAIKREQRLLADYAEREQRKDCDAGLIMGIMR